MDLLAQSTMKNAAKCDMSCELQDSVNHQIFERTLHPLFVMGMHGSVSVNKSQHTLCALENVSNMGDRVSYQFDQMNF